MTTFFQCLICHAKYIDSAPAAVLKKFSTPFGTGDGLPAIPASGDALQIRPRRNAHSPQDQHHIAMRRRPLGEKRSTASAQASADHESRQDAGQRPLDRDRSFRPDRHAPQRERQERAASEELSDLGRGRVRGRGGERRDAHEQRHSSISTIEPCACARDARPRSRRSPPRRRSRRHD